MEYLLRFFFIYCVTHALHSKWHKANQFLSNYTNKPGMRTYVVLALSKQLSLQLR